MTDISIDGMDELVAKLQELGATDEVVSKSAMAGALVLEGAVKVSMQNSHGGRTYTRGQKTHVASAPGQPPAIDYGFLINSIQSKEEKGDAMVFTNNEAAVPLEFGTARMQARPFMRPGVENNREAIINAIMVTAKRLIEEAAE